METKYPCQEMDDEGTWFWKSNGIGCYYNHIGYMTMDCFCPYIPIIKDETKWRIKNV